MKILIGGGLGGEDLLCRELSDLKQTDLTLWGGKFDPEIMGFSPLQMESVTHRPEFLDEDSEVDLTGYDLIVEVSENTRTKYLYSALAARHNLRYMTILFLDKWYLFDSGTTPEVSLGNCLPYTQPPLPCEVISPPQGWQNILKNEISNLHPVHKLDLLTGSWTKLSAEIQDDRWLKGQMNNAHSVACGGENTVSITPIQELKLDLSAYAERISSLVEIKRISPFFLEFDLQGLSCMLFRAGRLMITGIDQIQVCKWVFRNIVGL